MHGPADARGGDQARALLLSTIAFTVCFAVWTIFSIIGVQIKTDLGLNDTQFGLLVGTPILAGALVRVLLGVWADQTWMASIGEPSAEARKIWEAVREARDSAIQLVRERAKRGEAMRGADVDDAARGVIADRGYASFFTHRTGHSIDARDIHGSGPNLDNLETREERLLIPGVGFSIEPGIYVPGRSECAAR